MQIKDEFTDCETDIRLDGKVALVTGATSGSGFAIAKNLAKRGARVIIASRNATKLAGAKQDIINDSGNQNVEVRQVNYESLTSVRNLVGELRTEPRLDILINNIGAIGLQDKLTEDGLQVMMQVNYFGSFLLTFLLFPLMKKSAPSRIVNVSSLAVLLGNTDFDHWNDVGRYSNFINYGNAKLAKVLFTVEMSKRIAGSGVNIYSMDPGMLQSELFKHYDDTLMKKLVHSFLFNFGRPLNRVAMLPVSLAIDPKYEAQSGKHFRDCKEFYSSWFSNDTVTTKRLWKISKKLVKISKEEDWEITHNNK